MRIREFTWTRRDRLPIGKSADGFLTEENNALLCSIVCMYYRARCHVFGALNCAPRDEIIVSDVLQLFRQLAFVLYRRCILRAHMFASASKHKLLPTQCSPSIASTLPTASYNSLLGYCSGAALILLPTSCELSLVALSDTMECTL